MIYNDYSWANFITTSTIATETQEDDGEWIRGIIPKIIAELFRLVKYCILPRYMVHVCLIYGEYMDHRWLS